MAGKGIFGRLFGGKSKSDFDSSENEVPRRIEPKIAEERREEDEPGKLYMKAKKWREEQAMNEPLVKRSEYKRGKY